MFRARQNYDLKIARSGGTCLQRMISVPKINAFEMTEIVDTCPNYKLINVGPPFLLNLFVCFAVCCDGHVRRSPIQAQSFFAIVCEPRSAQNLSRKRRMFCYDDLWATAQRQQQQQFLQRVVSLLRRVLSCLTGLFGLVWLLGLCLPSLFYGSGAAPDPPS